MVDTSPRNSLARVVVAQALGPDSDDVGRQVADLPEVVGAAQEAVLVVGQLVVLAAQLGRGRA
jgi:hypothetical protein